MKVVDYNINAKSFFDLHNISIDEIFTDKFKTDKPELYEIFNSKDPKTYEMSFTLLPSYWEIRTKTVSNCKHVIYGHLKTIRNITETIHVQNNLEKIANTDFLSKLNNKREFINIGSKMIESASHNSKSKLSMLMIDIDNFKLVNDTFGHQVGDIVIEKIGLYLSKNFRDLDLTARIGGEEFAVIMLNTDAKLASEKAEALRKAIENSNIIDEDKSYKLTISIGISILREGMTLEDLIEEADKALYKAKDTGRNKVYYKMKITPPRVI
jgi:diguanylate cyclase (GGDEF)-like protein